MNAAKVLEDLKRRFPNEPEYHHGYDPDGVECPGKFGDGLEEAVKQFQSDRGLKVDGIAGRNTILKLMGV